MGIEDFNPSSEAFGSTGDLPEDQQAKFVDVEGGFIRKEAAEYQERMSEEAKEKNDARGIFSRAFGMGKTSEDQLIREEAIGENEWRDAINGNEKKDIRGYKDSPAYMKLAETHPEIEEVIKGIAAKERIPTIMAQFNKNELPDGSYNTVTVNNENKIYKGTIQFRVYDSGEVTFSNIRDIYNLQQDWESYYEKYVADKKAA